VPIDPDVRRASTLPRDAYDESTFRRSRDLLFARSWHVVDEDGEPLANEGARPLVLLPGCLDEPLVLTRDASGVERLLSNVCTHRANLVVRSACAASSLRCRYHGRRFGLDGKLAAMPEFEDALDFPRPQDDLPEIPSRRWGPLRFAGLAPDQPFDELVAPLVERIGFLPTGELQASELRDYELDAHWALYLDNYLEGFHVPFVHPTLNEALDWNAYLVEPTKHGVTQIALASKDPRRSAGPIFDLPEGHRDHGQRVAAYYFWLFPTTMVNAYPWGLSVNMVRPISSTRTRVTFASYVLDESLRDEGAGADLHRVEMEDEAVVEAVQRGIRSRAYRGGRFSPSRESGVHHFQSLLGAALEL
jgi:choline monooxygenase